MENQNYVVIERYQPKEGQLDAVLAATEKIGKLIEGFAGLTYMQVLQPAKAKDVVSMAIWESQEAFDRFLKSDALKDVMGSDLAKSMHDLTEGGGFDTYTLAQGWHAS